MEPNFYDREYLIVDEISYRLGEPGRGDIVVFRYPRDPEEYFIKRVIGLPGEKIQIKEGKVYIYNENNPEGAELEENYLADGIRTYSQSEEIISLGADEFFVLGDNRSSSKDSRSFGPVEKSYFIGRVMLRGWPFSRFNFFQAPQYSF